MVIYNSRTEKTWETDSDQHHQEKRSQHIGKGDCEQSIAGTVAGSSTLSASSGVKSRKTTINMRTGGFVIESPTSYTANSNTAATKATRRRRGDVSSSSSSSHADVAVDVSCAPINQSQDTIGISEIDARMSTGGENSLFNRNDDVSFSSSRQHENSNMESDAVPRSRSCNNQNNTTNTIREAVIPSRRSKNQGDQMSSPASMVDLLVSQVPPPLEGDGETTNSSSISCLTGPNNIGYSDAYEAASTSMMSCNSRTSDGAASHTAATVVRTNLTPLYRTEKNTTAANTSSESNWTFLLSLDDRDVESSPLRSGPICVDEVADENDDDDESASGSFWDNQTRLNMSDGDLLDERNSPGTLRLTKDGLERHERKAFEASLIATPGDTLSAWKKRQDKQKWFRQRNGQHITNAHERNGMCDDARKPVPTVDDAIPISNSDNKASGRRPATAIIKSLKNAVMSNKSKCDEDLANFPVAPLNRMDDIKPITAGNKTNCMKLPILNLFRGNNTSKKAMEILELERRAADEALQRKIQKKVVEEQRMDHLRRRRLVKERPKQAQLATKDRRLSCGGGLDVVEEGTNSAENGTDVVSNNGIETPSSATVYLNDLKRTNKQQVTTQQQPRTDSGASYHDLSTIASSVSNALPNCVVCNLRERTHIALPCMHFSFCQECVSTKLRKSGSCYVCSKPGVTFSAVTV